MPSNSVSIRFFDQPANGVTRTQTSTVRTDRGVWSSASTYNKNDLVLYGQYKYLCIVDVSKDVIPSVSSNWKSNWAIFSASENTHHGIGFDKLGSGLTLQANENEIN